MEMETRIAQLEMAERLEPDGDLMVGGYALVFDSPTVIMEYDGIMYSEMIKRGALNGADLSDIPFRYNHDQGVMVMARTRNKTLSVLIDEKGLKVNANLAKTTAGKDLYELIRRGDIDKMSFGMIIEKDSYDIKTRTRIIEKISRVGDVSAVDTPAYKDTSISVRGYFDAQREMEAKILADVEAKRKLLILKTYF